MVYNEWGCAHMYQQRRYDYLVGWPFVSAFMISTTAELMSSFCEPSDEDCAFTSGE
jgi:hypothetical protein